MSMTINNFSLDFISPYLLYDYVEDKQARVKIGVLTLSLASKMFVPRMKKWNVVESEKNGATYSHE